jgi:hypothetical protein
MAKKGPKREIIRGHRDYRALGRRVEALMKKEGLSKKAAARGPDYFPISTSASARNAARSCDSSTLNSPRERARLPAQV